MPRRLETEIKYISAGRYIFFDTEEHDELAKRLKPDTPEYFEWLASLKSFHFEGKEGRFTAQQEPRENKGDTIRKETYWSAYRKANKKQFRGYLGTTDKLTIATLEETARHLAEQCNAMPTVKQPRKRPVHRTVLQARIDRLEKELEAERARTAELEQEIQGLKVERARWIVQSRERQY